MTWAVRSLLFWQESECNFRKNYFIRGISCGRRCGYCTHWQIKLQLILKFIQHRGWHSPKSLSLLHPGFYHLTAFGHSLTSLWWGLLLTLEETVYACSLDSFKGSWVLQPNERLLAQLNLEWKSCPKCWCYCQFWRPDLSDLSYQGLNECSLYLDAFRSSLLKTVFLNLIFALLILKVPCPSWIRSPPCWPQNIRLFWQLMSTLGSFVLRL